eukprot:scaffold1527_cov155-Alexandrium_tamarense.AAC.2
MEDLRGECCVERRKKQFVTKTHNVPSPVCRQRLKSSSATVGGLLYTNTKKYQYCHSLRKR